MVSSVGLVSRVLRVSPVVPGMVSIVSLVVFRVGSVAVLTVGFTVVSVEFQISSLVGSTVGSGVFSMFRFVQPQPVNSAAVRTIVNAMVKSAFIFLPPNGFGFNGIITKGINFRQEKTTKELVASWLVNANKKSLKKCVFFVAFLSIHMYNRSVNK